MAAPAFPSIPGAPFPVSLDAPAEKVETFVDMGDQGLLRRQAQAHRRQDPVSSSLRASVCASVPDTTRHQSSVYQRRARNRVLSVRRPDRHQQRRAHPGRGPPLGGRGVLPDREDRSRIRPVPGPPLRRLVPPHHPRAAGAHLSLRDSRSLPKSIDSGLIPLTVGEIRRLLAHLNTPLPNLKAALHWST